MKRPALIVIGITLGAIALAGLVFAILPTLYLAVRLARRRSAELAALRTPAEGA